VQIVASRQPDLVVISALPPGARAHARYLCKRFRCQLSDSHLLIGIWNAHLAGKPAPTIHSPPNTRWAADFHQAVTILRQMAQPAMVRSVNDQLRDIPAIVSRDLLPATPSSLPRRP
jgi:hypothetical protein